MYFKFFKFWWQIYYKLFFKLRAHGLENVPEDCAAILCANHLSNYDAVTLALALQKLPCYLAKSQLFEFWLFRFLLLKLDAISIDREKADMSAYRAVMSALKKGRLVGIFAHGHRMKEADAKDAKSGVALFAVKSGAPVIPVAIVTDYKLFGAIDVVFGKPIEFSEYKGRKFNSEELADISTSIMEKVDEMVKEYK